LTNRAYRERVKKQLALVVAALVGVLLVCGQLAHALAGPEPNDPQDSLPAWASDGVHLAFERTAPNLQHVLAMTSAGKDLFVASGTGVFRGYVPGAATPPYMLLQVGSNTILTIGGRFSGPRAEFHGVDASASPDGTRVAYLRDGTLYVARIDNLAPPFPIPVPAETPIATGITPPGDDILGPVWSPSGKRIAIASGDSMLLVNSDGSGTQTAWAGDNENVNPSWASDTHLAWESNDHPNTHWHLDEWDACSRCGMSTLLASADADYRFPQYSPTGNTLAFISDKQHLKGGATPFQYALYTVAVGVQHKLLDDVHPYSPARFSPTGALIAVSAGQECRRWGIYIGRPDVGSRFTRRSNICRFDGTAGADTIHGSPYFDRINGLGGDDRLYGFNGNDAIYGENGNDVIVGGSGNDFILGGPGDDRISGGTGNDVIIPGNGHDVVDCGPGNDTVEGAGPLDRISKNCEHVRH
jgi:hemolysin type calcium-binding protein/WD40 repeat protein